MSVFGHYAPIKQKYRSVEKPPETHRRPTRIAGFASIPALAQPQHQPEPKGDWPLC